MPAPQESAHGAQPAAPRGLPPGAQQMMDPVAEMVEMLAQNAQTLGMVFNEKTAREAAKAKHLPPDQQPLPDMNDLKSVIDAQAQAIQAALAYRNDQRQSMAFQASFKKQHPKKEGVIGFGDSQKPKASPAPKPAAPGGF